MSKWKAIIIIFLILSAVGLAYIGKLEDPTLIFTYVLGLLSKGLMDDK